MIFQESFGWLFFRLPATVDGRRTRSTVMIQIAALYRQSGSDRLEKQPTDLQRNPRDLGDGALALSFPFQDS